MPDVPEFHFRTTVRTLQECRVVPLLGAGVNRVGRPALEPWQPRRTLPDGRELARYLAEYASYPDTDAHDLVRVSQYFSVLLGNGPLYDELHEIFDGDYEPTAVHRFLARVPGLLRAQGCLEEHLLVVTTNYDDALERAFREAGEPFDVVTYVADGEHSGHCLHITADGDARIIERPNEYRDVSLRDRNVVLKLHGAVDREDRTRDSYVITEDHYIDYLTRTDISGLVPVTLAAKLQHSHFLFLGYSMRDWNLRVILHRIWGQQKLRYNSWAVQLDPQPLDVRLWQARGVEIFDAPLDAYVERLAARLGTPEQAMA